MHFFEGDYSKAIQYHWLDSKDSPYIISGVLKAIRKPFVNMTFFKYPNQTAITTAGTLDKPIIAASRMPDGQVQIARTQYNAWGLPSQFTDPVGRETTIEYDATGQVAKKVMQKVGSGYETLAEVVDFDAGLRPLHVKDAAGKITAFTYNTRGQMATAADHLGEVTTITYQENTALAGYVKPLSVVSNRGPATSFTYDALDRVASTTTQNGYTVAYEYDAFDRLKKTTYPDGTTERNEYRFLALVKQYDREGKQTEYGYNPRRQLQWTRDSLNRLTQYEWCLCGALQKLTDPAGNVTAWEWNIIGQNLSKTYADGRVYHHTYDTAGRLATTLDPKGQTTRYTYTLDGAKASKQYENPEVATAGVSFANDPYYPRPISWTDAFGTTNYTYHPADGVTSGAGGLETVDGPWANDTISYLHDAQGRPAGYTLPGGGEAVTYDLLNRIATSTSVMGTTTLTYDGATSRVLSAIPTSGPRTYMTYGTAAEDFRLKQISNRSADGTILSRHSYTFTNDAQISTWQREYGGPGAPASDKFTFSYDGVDRLTGGVLKNSGTGAVLADHQFIQDAADNQVSIREGSSLKSGIFNSVNQLTAESGGGKARITGTINKPGTSVTVAGRPATVHPQGGFAVEVDAAPGANHFPLAACRT